MALVTLKIADRVYDDSRVSFNVFIGDITLAVGRPLISEEIAKAVNEEITKIVSNYFTEIEER